ncbi:hypothetical protein [Paenibacillus sp. MER 99-2]|uniref:hypothetical protein n=1 Tax=Paenibacillus sp. MER 99-2 TaxID=2939572 RepID=UPI00203A6E65|nr:hypothetical protein [Paenibacillus sp. MER 99-2]MCM3175180.1 hypothetical protein [Paenibacillus sp. MER 99-2]
MMKKKRNQWRKWQASAAATLAVAALFQYVRSSDAFDVAYASANGIDTSNTPNNVVATRDDVMDEWNNVERTAQIRVFGTTRITETTNKISKTIPDPIVAVISHAQVHHEPG